MDQQHITGSPADAALVSLTRRGDERAFRTLIARHERAVRLAVHVLGGAPELAGSTFEVAHGCLQREAGTSDAVRPFLLQLAYLLRHAPTPTGDLLRGDSYPCTPFLEADPSDNAAVAVAAAGLPPAWQAALWHRLVERDDDEAIGTAIGVAPLSVPWLVGEALSALRRTLVARHRVTSPGACRGYVLRLERQVDGGGVPRAVLRHADGCWRCAGLLEDLRAVETDLPRVLARSLLGDAGEGYVAAVVAAVP